MMTRSVLSDTHAVMNNVHFHSLMQRGLLSGGIRRKIKFTLHIMSNYTNILCLFFSAVSVYNISLGYFYY